MIRVEGLRFTYPGNPAETLRGLSFEIEQGEVFGFLGPSGSGKSTTQKILIGLLRGFAGSVDVRGRSLREYGTEYYESIGVGFELPNHFLKLSGLENMLLFRSLYKGRTRDPMELMRLVDLADDAHQRVSAYSKGMKMRLNFIRALLPDPEILFLDEPTAGMDPVNARRIKDLIVDLKRQGVVTPVRTADWLTSKVVSLTLLATVVAVALVLLTAGLGVDWLRLVPAFALVAALYTLVGFRVAARFQTTSGFFAAFGIVGLPLGIPILSYFGIWEHPLMWVNPAHSTMVLIRQAFRPGSGLELAAATLLTVFWIAVAFRSGVRAFHRRVSWRRGAA